MWPNMLELIFYSIFATIDGAMTLLSSLKDYEPYPDVSRN